MKVQISKQLVCEQVEKKKVISKIDQMRLWTGLVQAEVLQVWETSEATGELDKCEASWAPRQRAIPAPLLARGPRDTYF